ncbi:MAG TPA: hypothetical protein VJB14_17745 [Planctomycetota bacterium]|nr:hypothetical protein [Planctomycetota bacterium]
MLMLLACLALLQDPPSVEALVRRLDSEGVEERERAAAELVRRGGTILPELEKAWAASGSAEVKGRLRDIVRDILVTPEVRGLIEKVTSGVWSAYGAPERPALRDEMRLGIGRELMGPPARKAAYERLVGKRGPGDAFDWKDAEEGIAGLKKEKAAWCLASGLYHSTYLVQLRCAEALAELKDLRVIPALLDVAAALAVSVEGSKSATVHGFRQHGIAKAVDRLLGTSAAWGEGQNSEALRKALEVWREAYAHAVKPKSP